MNSENALRTNRHRGGLMLKIENSDKRGAALILEIIIYLVIVALIAVAVISGVAAIRNLVFTSHAKGDIQNVQTWMEGKYTQDNVYTAVALTPAGGTTGDMPRMTEANGVTNQFSVNIKNGADSGYCIKLVSNSISETTKKNFWLTSDNPSKIYQSGTATMGSATPPATGATNGSTCPA